MPLDPDQLARLSSNGLSSTEAEIAGIFRAVRECIRTAAVPCDGTGALQVICDNQGAVSALSRLRGNRRLFPWIARLYRLATNTGLLLSFVWQRRDTQEVVRADCYSKLQDPSDWRLSRNVIRSQITHQAPRLVEAKWYPPDIDVMASCWAHHVPQYISQFWDGASIAQDALVQDWGAWPLGTPTAGRHGRRSKPCLFVFPPSGLLAQVLLKIKVDQPTI